MLQEIQKQYKSACKKSKSHAPRKEWQFTLGQVFWGYFLESLQAGVSCA